LALDSDLADRIAKCEKILAGDEDSTVFAALADAYRRLGDLERAAHVCATGLERNPDYPTAHIVMAKIYIDQTMYDQAQRELSLVRGDETGQARAVQMLSADIAVRRRQHDKAREILEALLQEDPENDAARSLLELARREGEPEPVPVEAAAQQTQPTKPTEQTVEPAAETGDPLTPVVSLEGVLGAMYVTLKGTPSFTRFSDREVVEVFAFMASEIVRIADEGLRKFGVGGFDHCLIETANRVIWVFSAQEDLLVVFAESNVGLGPLKLAAQESVAAIAGV
jgi:predicted regulator of Ras-like GTPase activity (Roadblock/LC7/MglB family)